MITYNKAKDAAKEIKKLMDNGDIRNHYSCYDYGDLQEMEEILQEWKESDDSKNDEFNDEYEFAHRWVNRFYHEEEYNAGML